MKKIHIIIILVFSLLIGLLTSMQIHSIESAGGGLVSALEVEEYRKELQEAQTKKEELRQELLAYEKEIETINERSISEDIFLDSQRRLLERYRMGVGLVDVKGPGITITIDDPPSPEDWEDEYSIIAKSYELLLLMINQLKAAGAEAISVNDQRIVASSTIVDRNDRISINGLFVTPPLNVKAIGDPEMLESFLAVRYGILDMMRDYSLRVSVSKQEELTIPRYYGPLQIRHAAIMESAAAE